MHRWVLVILGTVAVACGGGSGDGPTAPNLDPSASAQVSPPGVAIVDVTDVLFTASGVDPEGAALDFDWDFGDGTRATGRTVTHVYSMEGMFDVVLTATDDRGGRGSTRFPLEVGSLSGQWTPLQNGVPGIVATLTQMGSAITGESTNSCCTHTFSGAVVDPRTITLDFRFAGCPDQSRILVGSVSPDLKLINLSGPNCNVPSTTFGFVR